MEGGQLLQTRIGGVPLLAIVGLGAAGIALLLAFRSRSGKVSTGADMLSPSAAEAFGTLQQQQQDLGNALSALGMGQQELSQQAAAGQNVTSTQMEGLRQLGYGIWNMAAGGAGVVPIQQAVTDATAYQSVSSDLFQAAAQRQQSLPTLAVPSVAG